MVTIVFLGGLNPVRNRSNFSPLGMNFVPSRHQICSECQRNFIYNIKKKLTNLRQYFNFKNQLQNKHETTLSPAGPYGKGNLINFPSEVGNIYNFRIYPTLIWLSGSAFGVLRKQPRFCSWNHLPETGTRSSILLLSWRRLSGLSSYHSTRVCNSVAIFTSPSPPLFNHCLNSTKICLKVVLFQIVQYIPASLLNSLTKFDSSRSFWSFCWFNILLCQLIQVPNCDRIPEVFQFLRLTVVNVTNLCLVAVTLI